MLGVTYLNEPQILISGILCVLVFCVISFCSMPRVGGNGDGDVQVPWTPTLFRDGEHYDVRQSMST